jgi:response regulator RpfG family c-di-GMP phosphodiesterase
MAMPPLVDVQKIRYTIVYQIVRKKGRADRMIRVLLVEDDPVIRDTTCYFLKSQQNFEVVCAETGGDALSHAREKFDVI